MNTKKQLTYGTLLLVLGLILVACAGQAVEAEPLVSKETTASEQPAADPNASPLDAELDDTWERPADGMTLLYVPQGSFPMGRANGFSNERPVHEVSQDAFWIDGTEVTNEHYALCVNDGGCDPSEYADDPDYNVANHPVMGVSWFDAAAYCEWADARLPTEAEWEYAARGPEGLAYPWGDDWVQEVVGEKTNSCDTHCSKLARAEQIDDGYRFSAPAGNYPAGASWAGALDMSGNVSEWVQDWYDDAYYSNSPELNPQGPEGGETKSLRGGSLNDPASVLFSAARDNLNPDDSAVDIGFRCVVTPGV